jgi:hypothetical protein
LQKAKADGNAAVEKLKKSEENLAQIKEKNAQLSDELLNKSRQVCRGRIFSHAGKELGASSFLAENKFLNYFPLHHVPSWEQARFQTD